MKALSLINLDREEEFKMDQENALKRYYEAMQGLPGAFGNEIDANLYSVSMTINFLRGLVGDLRARYVVTLILDDKPEIAKDLLYASCSDYKVYFDETRKILNLLHDLEERKQ